jgi:hypothetical protein
MMFRAISWKFFNSPVRSSSGSFSGVGLIRVSIPVS